MGRVTFHLKRYKETTPQRVFALTSLWNILKTLKTFLRWAYEAEVTKERTYERVKKKDYHVIEPPIVRLSESELKAIAELDLSDGRRSQTRETCSYCSARSACATATW